MKYGGYFLEFEAFRELVYMGGGIRVILVSQRAHGIFDAKTVWWPVKMRRFLL